MVSFLSSCNSRLLAALHLWNAYLPRGRAPQKYGSSAGCFAQLNFGAYFNQATSWTYVSQSHFTKLNTGGTGIV